MNAMVIRMVGLDLDGTLLDPEEFIDEEAKETLEKLFKLG